MKISRVGEELDQSHSKGRKCQGAEECAVAEIGNAGFVPFIDKVISMKVLGHSRVEWCAVTIQRSTVAQTAEGERGRQRETAELRCNSRMLRL